MTAHPSRLWWLAAPLPGAALAGLLITPAWPALSITILAVWLAATVAVCTWVLRDRPVPASRVTGADLLTTISTAKVTAIRPRAGRYPTHETAIAESCGVYRPRHADDTPTEAIPVVKP
jgi:hypothetical protein